MQNVWKKFYAVLVLSLFLASTTGKAEESAESVVDKTVKTLKLHRKKALALVGVAAVSGLAFWKRDVIADRWNSLMGEKVEIVEKKPVEEVGFAIACINTLRKMWKDLWTDVRDADRSSPFYLSLFC